ncbi:MAG TPA: tetratricopeptide repeat protein [Rariglobus sp.]|jgi:tetratricopeptide (TPR) repeat protein|nr:tetratricopeptide repeat protein [Rariglobus sp.]
MKRFIPLLCAAVVLLGGCKDKPKVLSPEAKLKAENFVSEAQFSMQIHEYSRAEDLFQKAIAVRDDYPEYWVALGMARRRQDNKDGARQAYKKALGLLEDRYDLKKNEEDLGQKAWVLALLGRPDDAVAFLNKSLKEHPDSTYLQKMASAHGLPHTFQTADFKELAL